MGVRRIDGCSQNNRYEWQNKLLNQLEKGSSLDEIVAFRSEGCSLVKQYSNVARRSECVNICVIDHCGRSLCERKCRPNPEKQHTLGGSLTFAERTSTICRKYSQPLCMEKPEAKRGYQPDMTRKVASLRFGIRIIDSSRRGGWWHTCTPMSLIQSILPYPRAIRAMGFPKEVSGIRGRYLRCRDYWANHLERSQSIILQGAQRAELRRKAVVLGGGLLHDVPLAELSAMFREVILVDVIHPWSSRWTTRHLRNVTRLEADVTNTLDETYRLAWDGDMPLPKSCLLYTSPSPRD